MSEIRALKKLREQAEREPLALTYILNDLADEIQAEIDERFCKLPEGWTAEQASEVLGYWPRWDDGTPCMFGDEFTCYPKYDHEQKYEVLDRLSIFGQNHVWNRGCDNERPHDGGYYEWNYMRPGGDDCESYRPTKRKPRTLEDVLADVVTLCANTWKDGESPFAFYDVSDVMESGNIREYADEIRELMKEGGE